ncbi:MAG: hypothetical protein WC789_03900 [Lentisphaeria bacterium]|jgi:hypothetical protein
MNCHDVQQELLRDGGWVSPEMEKHLAACGECRGFKRVLHLAELPPGRAAVPAPPAAVDAAIRAAARRPRPGLWLRLAAAAVLVLGLTLVVHRWHWRPGAGTDAVPDPGPALAANHEARWTAAHRLVIPIALEDAVINAELSLSLYEAVACAE